MSKYPGTAGLPSDGVAGQACLLVFNCAASYDPRPSHSWVSDVQVTINYSPANISLKPFSWELFPYSENHSHTLNHFDELFRVIVTLGIIPMKTFKHKMFEGLSISMRVSFLSIPWKDHLSQSFII